MSKCKSIILIIVMIVMTQIVIGMRCEVSLDNLTDWINISNIIYGGDIDDELKKANLPMLDEDTPYFMRCRNETHNWSYASQRTNAGWEENMLAIIIGIIAVIIVFGIIGYAGKTFSIKSFGYGIALIQLVNIVFILYLNETDGSLTSILRVNFWAVFFLAFGIGMIGLIRWTIRLVNPGDQEKEEKRKWGR